MLAENTRTAGTELNSTQVVLPGISESKSRDKPYRNYNVKKKTVNVVKEIGVKYYT